MSDVTSMDSTSTHHRPLLGVSQKQLRSQSRRICLLQMGHSAPIWIRYIKNYQAKIGLLLGMIPLTSATQKQRQSSTKITNASEKPWLPRRWKAQDLREDHDPNDDPSQHKATADLTWLSLVASYASVTNLGGTPGPDASFQPVPEVVPTCSNQEFQHHLVGGWPTPRKIWQSQYMGK